MVLSPSSRQLLPSTWRVAPNKCTPPNNSPAPHCHCCCCCCGGGRRQARTTCGIGRLLPSPPPPLVCGATGKAILAFDLRLAPMPRITALPLTTAAQDARKEHFSGVNFSSSCRVFVSVSTALFSAHSFPQRGRSSTGRRPQRQAAWRIPRIARRLRGRRRGPLETWLAESRAAPRGRRSARQNLTGRRAAASQAGARAGELIIAAYRLPAPLPARPSRQTFREGAAYMKVLFTL